MLDMSFMILESLRPKPPVRSHAGFVPRSTMGRQRSWLLWAGLSGRPVVASL